MIPVAYAAAGHATEEACDRRANAIEGACWACRAACVESTEQDWQLVRVVGKSTAVVRAGAGYGRLPGSQIICSPGCDGSCQVTCRTSLDGSEGIDSSPVLSS